VGYDVVASDEDVSLAARKCLQSILTLQAVQSLHLFWQIDSWFNEFLVGTLPSVSNLTSFSISGPSYPYDELAQHLENPSHATEIRRSLLCCHNLQALGWITPPDEILGERVGH
jgi:hypothetical protein